MPDSEIWLLGAYRDFAPNYDTWYICKGYQGWSIYQRNDFCDPTAPTIIIYVTNHEVMMFFARE